MNDKTTRPSTVFLQLWQQMTVLDPEMPGEDFARYAETWAKIRDLERADRTWRLVEHKDPPGEPRALIEDVPCTPRGPEGPGDPSGSPQDDNERSDQGKIPLRGECLRSRQKGGGFAPCADDAGRRKEETE